jgi:septal ring factor EnvC (AmiA/AmiB activator)
MKLVEALKELKLIEKKLDKNREQIIQYASKLSVEKPQFETDRAQEQKVQSLIQANNDLIKNYVSLTNRITYTNITTFIDYEGESYRVADLLVYVRKMHEHAVKTIGSLNETAARIRMKGFNMQQGEKIYVDRFYKEEFKNAELQRLEKLDKSRVIARLETLNAVTDLAELPIK